MLVLGVFLSHSLLLYSDTGFLLNLELINSSRLADQLDSPVSHPLTVDKDTATPPGFYLISGI